MYDHLLSLLGRAHADLLEAERVACELARDKCLDRECRNLDQMVTYLGSVEKQVRRRAMDTRSSFPAAPS
jgi:hypothetical protein